MDAAAKRELDVISSKFDKLLKSFSVKERKKIIGPAANILKKEAQSNIKDSAAPHYRYSTAKLNKNIRAPKGKGKVIATYRPGNLRNSIGRLPFRRSSAIFIGPKLSKKNKSGDFGSGNKVDGYYAHWQEFGTVNDPQPRNFGFMRRALASSRGRVIKKIESRVKLRLKRFENANKI